MARKQSTKGQKAAAPKIPCRCSLDGASLEVDMATWQSPAGGCLVPEIPEFDPEAIDEAERSIWRYRAMFPVEVDDLKLGEGATPLLETSVVGMPVWVKLDFLQPSGSYKDRGSALMAAGLAQSKARSAVIDSSGNAAASLAAYAARLNLPLQVFVPAGTPAPKMRQAAAFGATIDASAESRDAAAHLAQAAVGKSTYYASHVYSPLFLAGQMTMAWEIWEDMGRQAPDCLVVPVGNGLLALGLALGFEALLEAELIERRPRIYGVQAASCAPIFEAFTRGADEAAPTAARPTLASGIRIESPPRGREVLAAVRKSEGAMVNVSEAEIQRGQALAANLGWFVEPSAAVGLAGLVKLDKVIDAGWRIVVPLTGSGLKD